MSDAPGLPRGWVLIPLRDLGEWSGGGTPPKSVSSFWSGGSIPWVSPKDMKVPVISDSMDHITDDAVRSRATKLIPRGSVLFVTRSGILAHTMPVARTAVPVTVNQDIKALTPIPPLDPDYIAWGARAFGWTILNHCCKDGTTVASVDTELLQRFPLPIAPPREQHRIVEAIESCFTRLEDAVSTLERVQRNLKRYRASVLKAAVEGRLVRTEADLARAEGRDYEPASALLERILVERRRRWEEAELAKMKAKGKVPKDDRWKAKYKEPVAPDAEDLPELPEGWCWATVESISSKVVDGVHKKPVYVDTGIPFVTVKNLTAGPGVSFEGLRYITEADHGQFTARTNPERGDLLVSKDGTLGVVRAIRTDETFSIFVSVALVKPVHREMTDYLEVALSSPVMQAQMIPKGSGLQHIHLEDLRADCVPVPPLAEWSRICAEVQRHLSVAEELEREATRNVGRLARLRQSILKWAFEGRLVDQDPTDEPASALLESIRAERKTKPVQQARTRRRARAAKKEGP